jgi:hypothetical protein
VSEDRFQDLAPLAALDALDGEERQGFEDHEASCPACRKETAAYRHVAALLPLALERVPPDPHLRARVTGPAPRSSLRGGLLAMAAALLLAVGSLISTRSERDQARREARAAQAMASVAQGQTEKTAQELVTLRERLGREVAFETLASAPDSRMVHLSGADKSPGAGACVVWNPVSAEAVLIAAGLAPAPKGHAYEVWVIAGAAPVPAGVFQADASGKALVRLPAVAAIARVKTFAVTVEPAAGTAAPTGPMVLTGAVS